MTNWITETLQEVTKIILKEMQNQGWRCAIEATRSIRHDKPTVWDINCGWCEEWAELAAESLGDGAVALWLDEIDPIFEDTSHMVVFFNDRFYDSQTLEGVYNPKDLPLIKCTPRSSYEEF